jgi:uncharacterized OB-fold protein
MSKTSKVLRAPFSLEFTYTRSVGPVLGAFFDALGQRRILGVRAKDGRVIVPPQEYDPVTADELDELVEVADTGTVTTWSWTSDPKPGQPLDRPFAWALIRFDGADTPMLHAVDAGRESAMSTGMRVQVRWRDETVGDISDIVCFVPASESERAQRDTSREPTDTPFSVPNPTDSAAFGAENIGAENGKEKIVERPINLDYTYTAGRAQSRFLQGIIERRLIGERCPSCAKVYVPPRGSCPTCGVPTADQVELPGTGTVTTFCVVNIPFAGQAVECPYVSATVLLDGADIGIFHLIQEIPADEVRMGLRVEPVWKDELQPTLESIKYFKPTGEPDADYESFRTHT